MVGKIVVDNDLQDRCRCQLLSTTYRSDRWSTTVGPIVVDNDRGPIVVDNDLANCCQPRVGTIIVRRTVG